MKILTIALPLWLSVTVTSVLGATEISDIRLGEPAYAGSGCPQGSAAIISSPDGSMISVMFTQFSAQVLELDSTRLQRKTCALAIPVMVPPGVSVKPNFAQFTGFYDVTMNNYVRFTVETFFAGMRGPNFVQQFQDEDAQSDFVLRTDAPPNSYGWSPCGQDVVLRFNMSLFASGRAELGRSAIAIDQMQPGGDDGQALLVRSCER